MNEMPLLSMVSSLYSDSHLKDVRILACQHLLDSTHTLLKELINKGVERHNIAVIGKCYSTSQSTIKSLMNDGIYVDKSSNYFDSHLPYTTQLQRNIQAFLDNQLLNFSSNNHPIILIDDGGELILNANKYAHKYNFIGIEQTTSGYNKLNSNKPTFPVVNVARSETKLNLESPLISRYIKNTITSELEKRQGENILILGAGPIGKMLYKELSPERNCKLYDNKFTSDQTLQDHLSNSKIIIGATGKTSVPHEMHKLIKQESTLISASSSDMEFDAVHIRKKLPNISNCHSNVIHNGISLLNCGFPINFHGGNKVSLPADEIQLTISLLFLGVCQAKSISSDANGFYDLNLHAQKLIQKHFTQLKKSKANANACDKDKNKQRDQA